MGIEKQKGIVAILDALGASSYSDEDVEQFLNSRQRIISKLGDYLEEKTEISAEQVKTFTFNDTIVIALLCGIRAPSLDQISAFCAVLRKFIVDSMNNGLLFRGAAALGEFRADDLTNTIMGDAVTDAAQWYEETDWIGVHFTPRSFLHIERDLHGAANRREWAMLPYKVPLKGGKTLDTFAVNWPRIFTLKKARPWDDNLAPRVKLLRFLGKHRVPMGTEQKYFNTIAFFDASLNQTKSAKKPAT